MTLSLDQVETPEFIRLDGRMKVSNTTSQFVEAAVSANGETLRLQIRDDVGLLGVRSMPLKGLELFSIDGPDGEQGIGTNFWLVDEQEYLATPIKYADAIKVIGPRIEPK